MLSLSYDCTFYAMLLLSIGRACTGFKNGRCVCNPLKKCSFAQSRDDSYSKTAAFSVISVYYKLLDDIKDSGFFKKAAVVLIKPFFLHWRKKAAGLYPEIDALAQKMMEKQGAAENSRAFWLKNIKCKNICISVKNKLTVFSVSVILSP